MKIGSFLNFAACAVLAISLAGAPAQLRAQSTNKAPAKKSATEKKEAGEKKSRPVPFNGELKALDKVAKTATVGKRVFQITSDTKVYKGDKTPATLDDAVVGQPVRGSYHKTEDGKLLANSIYFGPKGEQSGTPEKKKGKAEK